MKKRIALFIAHMLLIGVAFAEDGLTMPYNGQSITLPFDDTGEYSYIKDGYVGATFYSIDMMSLAIYEAMLYFPEDVESGTVVSSDDASVESGVYFAVTDMTGDSYNYGEISGGELNPSGASYTITFNTVNITDTQAHYEGVFTAHLITVDSENNPVSDMTIENATFSCTISKTATDSNDSDSGAEPNPFDLPDSSESTDPSASPEPQVPFTTPAPKGTDKTIYKV